MGFLKDERGVALPLVLIILVVAWLLGSALWSYSVGDLRLAVREEYRSRAYYLARAGAEALARHIMRYPEDVEAILEGGEQKVSEIITLETDYLGKAGELQVSLQRLDSNHIAVMGRGTADGVTESVRIVLATEGFFDGVVYSKGSLNFHSNVLLEGDIASGGTIKLPNNFSGSYQENLSIDFPPPVFPDEPEEYSGDLSAGAPLEITASPLQAYRKIHIGNKKKLIINAQSGPVTIQTRYFEMHNNGSMEFVTRAGHDITLVVDEIVIKQVTISGDGIVYLYVRSAANVQTPHAVISDQARLVFYLEKGCMMDIQANSMLEGLVYGPEATVSMGGNADFTGAMIVEQLKGIGGNAKIGAAGTEIRRKYSWDLLDLDYGGYWLVYWTE